MAITFPPTAVQQIDLAIQAGLGAAAQVIGQTFDVRRMDQWTNISISSNQPVLSGFPASVFRTTTKALFENQTLELVVFQATCDRTNLQLLDVCTQTGTYRNDGSVFTVVQMRPLQPTLWMSTPSAVTITRPVPAAGRASQMPVSGPIATPGYSGVTKSTEQILTLVDGLYEFVEPGVPGLNPCTVQCGLQPTQRVRDGREPKLPTALYREHFQIYCPIIPGAYIRELDRFSFPSSGDRYEAAMIFTSEMIGLAGYIIVAEKLAT
jgi:hypothetical protein